MASELKQIKVTSECITSTDCLQYYLDDHIWYRNVCICLRKLRICAMFAAGTHIALCNRHLLLQ